MPVRTEDSLKTLEESFHAALRSKTNLNLSDVLSPADGFYFYRLLLGRNPDPEIELPRILNGTLTLRKFLTDLTSSAEFSYRSGYLPAGHMLMSESSGFRFWFNTSDREMGVLMGFGMYEPETTQLLRKLVRPGMHCLDIGAQTGFYTCLMAAATGPAGKVFAFEPMPQSYDLLARNVLENDFGDFVSHYQLACSDRAQELSASFVSGMYVVGDIGGADRVSMHAERADDVVTGRIDLLKIDIEGHEPAALRGMSRLLQDRPLIVSEANEYWLRTCSDSSAQDYVRSLIDLGYDVYNVDNLRKPIQPAIFQLEILQNVNLLAVPAGQPLARYIDGGVQDQA